jgi:hypothetical protein
MKRRAERGDGERRAEVSTSRLSLRIRLTRRGDGAILSCTRADGSTTWQKHGGTQAAFFPYHDLMHYAVESALGLDRGFFGLVAAGWDIEDTTGKGARGPIPGEAIVVEHLVGLLAVERSDGTRLTADRFDEEMASFATSRGLPAPAPVDDESLRELFARWGALEDGGALEVEFSRRSIAP